MRQSVKPVQKGFVFGPVFYGLFRDDIFFSKSLEKADNGERISAKKWDDTDVLKKIYSL